MYPISYDQNKMDEKVSKRASYGIIANESHNARRKSLKTSIVGQKNKTKQNKNKNKTNKQNKTHDSHNTRRKI